MKMTDDLASSPALPSEPKTVKSTKTPIIEGEIKEARRSFLQGAQFYRRLSAGMKLASILLAVFAAIFAALDTSKGLTIFLTASLSAITAIDSAFHIHEMTFRKSIAAITTWKLLDEFRLKNAKIAEEDSEGFRRLEHYIRGKIKALWEESITAELRPGHFSTANTAS
jgi:hypothetical protein